MVRKQDRQPINREERARMAYQFCREIAPNGVVRIPTYRYVGKVFGWSDAVAGTAVRDLMISGALARTGPGVYEVLDWDGKWRRSP